MNGKWNLWSLSRKFSNTLSLCHLYTDNLTVRPPSWSQVNSPACYMCRIQYLFHDSFLCLVHTVCTLSEYNRVSCYSWGAKGKVISSVANRWHCVSLKWRLALFQLLELGRFLLEPSWPLMDFGLKCSNLFLLDLNERNGRKFIHPGTADLQFNTTS